MQVRKTRDGHNIVHDTMVHHSGMWSIGHTSSVASLCALWARTRSTSRPSSCWASWASGAGEAPETGVVLPETTDGPLAGTSAEHGLASDGTSDFENGCVIDCGNGSDDADEMVTVMTNLLCRAACSHCVSIWKFKYEIVVAKWNVLNKLDKLDT